MTIPKPITILLIGLLISTVTAQIATVTLTLSPSTISSSYGEKVNFNLQVQSATSPQVDGTVVLTDGLNLISQSQDLYNNQASFSVCGLPPGTNLLTFRYQGTSTYAAATAYATLKVDQIRSKVLITTSNEDLVYGNQLILRAVISHTDVEDGQDCLQTPSPTGFVEVSEAGDLLESVTLSKESNLVDVTLQSLSQGDHLFVVRYSGDSYHLPSTTTYKQAVIKAATEMTVVTQSKYTYGTLHYFVIQVKSTDPEVQTIPAGTIYYSLDDSDMNLLQDWGSQKQQIIHLCLSQPSGSHSLLFSFIGTGYEPSSYALQFQMERIETSIQADWSAGSGLHGETVSLAGIVSATPKDCNNQSIYGQIGIYNHQKTLLATTDVQKDGSFVFFLRFDTVKNKDFSFSLHFFGNEYHQESNKTISLSTRKAFTEIEVSVSPKPKDLNNETKVVNIRATVKGEDGSTYLGYPTGSIHFTTRSGYSKGLDLKSGHTTTLTLEYKYKSDRNVTIETNYSGDANFLAASSSITIPGQIIF